MNELIIRSTINGAEVNSVNARDLHKELGVKTQFSVWVKRAIDKYDFVVENDYSTMNIANDNGGKDIEEYILTIEAVKYILNVDKKVISYKIKNNSIDINLTKKKKKWSNTLYLISDGKYTKIGITTGGASNRLKTLQTGNARKLYVVFETFIKKASRIERQLHIRYADKRLQGEWFELTDNDIKNIKGELLCKK